VTRLTVSRLTPGPVEVLQVGLDPPGAHPARLQRDELLIQPSPAALTLVDQLRAKPTLAIPRRVDPDRPAGRQHRLRGPTGELPTPPGRARPPDSPNARPAPRSTLARSAHRSARQAPHRSPASLTRLAHPRSTHPAADPRPRPATSPALNPTAPQAIKQPCTLALIQPTNHVSNPSAPHRGLDLLLAQTSQRSPAPRPGRLAYQLTAIQITTNG
jgi:hypothetical protein